MPQFDVSTLTDLTDRPVSSGVISSADHEAWRNDIEARITALNNAAKAIAANQSGSAEPTVKHQGEIFFDTDNNYWYANPAGGGYSDNVLTRLTAFNFNLATGGTATHKLMGAINVNTTANARTTTGDFTAYTLPGGSLGADGQLIRATFWGTRSGVAGTFSLQPIFGTTNIGTAFASTIDSLTDWMVQLLIIRTGAATQDCFFHVVVNRDDTGSTTLADFDGSVAETLSGDLAVKLNLAAISAGTVTQEGFLVELMQ